MTQLSNDPKQFAATALRGFCDIYSRIVQPTPGGVLRATATPEGKVAVVIGGGSGHYPAFVGYVGTGLADAAVAGDIFASPSTRLVHDVSMRANRGGGILLGFGNYAGDVLNFGAAATRLRGQGIDVRVLAVTDDIASAKQGDESRRRGTAGDVTVFKIAGAAAESGMKLDEVERLARLANDRTRSFGVAFGGCTLPHADAPLFSVPQGRMAVGLGIHGEPGIDEIPKIPASELAELLVSRLLQEAPSSPGTRIAAILNGLGSSKYEELFVLWSSVAEALRTSGLTIVAPLVGEYVTSLDMEGCSLTLTWLDAELEPLWLAPCNCASLRIGNAELHAAVVTLTAEVIECANWPPASAESQFDGQAIARGFALLSEALNEAAEELGRIDAQAGDGDHGLGMSRGSTAAAAAARDAANAGAGAASVLAAGAEAWTDVAGGTSGALWGLGLRSASTALDDNRAVTPSQAAAAVFQALQNVMASGGAKPGDKTLVDALAPFAETLSAAIDAGAPISTAWKQAAQAAHTAAEGTANLIPRLGRARPLAERSKGHRDAGAVSFALAANTILQLMGEQNGRR
jgi:dihydroxyacetone kinase